MISWRDDAILLNTKPLGENSVIIDVFSPEQGKCSGVVRGGTSRKMTPILQPGAQLSVAWKARLEEHLGAFTAELSRSRTAQVMQDRLALAGLNAVCGLLVLVLPEREPHLPLYERTTRLLDLLGDSELWPLAYLRWEQALLGELGFALDLSACAVTGATSDLIYVSPKSGRAVCRDGAGDWADRLLPLTPVLAGEGDAEIDDILEALGTTGFFIEHKLVKGLGDRPMPVARERLLDAIRRYGSA